MYHISILDLYCSIMYPHIRIRTMVLLPLLLVLLFMSNKYICIYTIYSLSSFSDIYFYSLPFTKTYPLSIPYNPNNAFKIDVFPDPVLQYYDIYYIIYNIYLPHIATFSPFFIVNETFLNAYFLSCTFVSEYDKYTSLKTI